MGTELWITAYEVSLAQFASFNYMGQVLEAEDDDWLVVVRNLRRARQKWAWLTRILSRAGSDARN